MEYGMNVEDRSYAVKLEEIEKGREFIITVNGKLHHVLLRADARSGNLIEFIADNRPRSVSVLRRAGMNRMQVSIDGFIFDVNRGLSHRPFASRRPTPAPPREFARKVGIEEGILSAPTPGRIVLINVKKGDQVKKGDVLLILESMKMETTLRANGSGTVGMVKVSVGDNVSRGDILVSLKRAGDSIENDG